MGHLQESGPQAVLGADAPENAAAGVELAVQNAELRVIASN